MRIVARTLSLVHVSVADLWPFVARDDELALIERDRSGVVLIGEAGVGKSRLLSEYVERIAATARRAFRVAATESLAAVPFGAFAGALAHDVEPGAPFDSLARAIRALAGDGPIDDIVIAVDDAHLLDDASAGLLLVAAQSGARVLATLRSREQCPEAITRLWKDEFARRLEVRALGEREVGDVLQAALGAPIEQRSRHRLFEVTRGNLLFLRELVRHGRDEGAFVERGGVWSWSAPAAVAPGVLDLVEGRLRRVSSAVNDVIEVLALSEPLGRSVVDAVCSPQACDEAEAEGLITTVTSGVRHDLRLVHPLYAQSVAARIGAAQRRTIAGRVAAALDAIGTRRRDDRLRIALLRLDAGVPGDAHEFNVAATEAGVRGDLALAERLARAAVAAGGSSESEVLLGDILYWAGRYEELVALLGRDLPDDATPEQIGRAARLVSAALYWGLNRFDDANAWLERGVRRAGPEQALVLLAQRSEMLFFAGRIGESLDVGRAVLRNGAASNEARLRAFTGVLNSEVGRGRFAAVEAEFPVAMELVARAGPDLAIYTTGGVMVAMFTVRLFTGGLEEVDVLIGALHDEALQRPDDPFVGVWSFLLGRSALGQGHIGDAIRRLRDAASLLRPRDPGGMLPWTLASLAQALGAADDRMGARAAVDELMHVRSPAMHHIDMDIELGRAWAACAQGERSHAREIAEKAGRSLMEDGRVALGAVALHDALRLGVAPTEVIDALEHAAATCDGPIIAAFARHARARIDDDLDALLDVADEFEAAGWLLHAAECAAGASNIAAAEGLRARRRDAAVRSAALAKACGPALTPMLESVAGKQALGTLTRREQEIALLAARGMSKREIAEMLFLSARTVGNHINHVYSKLGIGSREELRIALHIGAGAQVGEE